MRTMANLVSDILNMKNTDLEMLAEALALYDSRKAERFNFFLETHIREYDSLHRSISQYESMKELEKTETL